MKFSFVGYGLKLQHLSSDNSVRVKIETSMDQYDLIKDIPKLPKGIYKITVETLVEED